jgi:hypothetical protein
MLAVFAVISLTLNSFGPLISKQLDRGSDSHFWGCFLFGLKTSEWFLVAFGWVFGSWAMAPRAMAAITFPLFATLALIWGFEVFPGMPSLLAWIFLIGGLLCTVCMAIGLRIQSGLFGWELTRIQRTEENLTGVEIAAISTAAEKSSAQNQIELRWLFLLMLVVALGIPSFQWVLAKTDNSPSRFQWLPVLVLCFWFALSIVILSCVMNAVFMRPRRWFSSMFYLLFFLAGPWLYLVVAQLLVQGTNLRFSLKPSNLTIAYEMEAGAITGISCILGIAWLSGYRFVKNQNSSPRSKRTGTLWSP